MALQQQCCLLEAFGPKAEQEGIDNAGGVIVFGVEAAS
jgi:hypothetical protein